MVKLTLGVGSGAKVVTSLEARGAVRRCTLAMLTDGFVR